MDNMISADKISVDVIEKLKRDLVAAADACRSACQAYHEEVAGREANLAKQAAEFSAGLEKAKGKRKRFAAMVADYTSRGKIDEAAEADAKVEAVDREIAALARKLRLVKSAKVKGDPGLYEAAQTAYQTVETEKAAYMEHLDRLRAIVRDENDRLKAVAETIGLCARCDHTGAVYGNFQKVDRHYRDLDRIEREARERWQAEQEAARAAESQKRNVHVIVPPSA